MTVNLEERLREELALDADRAPIACPEWNDVRIVAIEQLHSPQRLLARTLSIAAAVMLVVGAVVAIAMHRSEPRATGFVPPGTEVPLTDQFPQVDPTPAAIPATFGVLAKPGSVQTASVPDIAGWLLTYDSVDYDQNAGTVSAQRCLAMADVDGTLGTMCGPPTSTSSAGSGGDSSGTRSQWVQVPNGTSAVGYVDGAGKSWWQRPIGRMSIFPRTQSDGTFTAYAQDGTVLQVFDATRYLGGFEVGPVLTEDSLTLGQRRDFHDIVSNMMRNCVNSYGATYPNGLMFPVLPADADPPAWDTCVAFVTTVVDQRFAALGGRLISSVRPIDEPPADSTAQPATTQP